MAINFFQNNANARPAEPRPETGQGTRGSQGAGTAPADRGRDDAEAGHQARRQQAFRTVEQTLARGYEQLAARSGAERFAAFEPLSAEKVAGNILGFIERRLQKDAAEGASTEALQSRLEAGLKGFERGFAEAREQLEALAGFTPQIRADIDDTRDRVLSGIDDLRQRIVDGQLQTPERSRAPAPESARSSYAYEQARSSRFSFELTTAEGDRVRIDASRMSAASARGDGDGERLAGSANQSLRWHVDGELNGDERQALEALLGDVDRRAEQFFRGDLSGAMASARELGYDDEQIAGFALNLRQTEVRRASEAYGQVGGDSGPGLQERLAPVGEFMRGLEGALDRARPLSAEPASLLLDTARQMAGGDRDESAGQARSLSDFMADLLETLTTGPEREAAEQRNDTEDEG